MIMPNVKKKHGSMVAAILGPQKSRFASGYAEGGEVEPEVDGQTAAMEEFVTAVHAKDASAAKAALKSFMSMCEDEEAPAAEDETGL